MAFQTKPLTSTIRHPSMGGSLTSSGQSSLLTTRINEKKTELENLKQLQDLSANLAAQMQTLEQKLATLSDGSEGLFSIPLMPEAYTNMLDPAVAAVLANWHNVLRAINMASSKVLDQAYIVPSY